MSDPSARQREFVLAALDQYECRLTRYALRLLDGDMELARDVVQHSFMKLCQQDLQTVSQRLAPWLFQVCRNRAIDERRRHKPLRESETETRLDHVNGHSCDPGRKLEQGELVSLVGKLIDQLPRGEREVAELWSQSFSNQEIAEVTGRSEGAVRVALHRGLKQIRQHPSVQRLMDERLTTPSGNRR